jgi:hypothetical protein
MHILRNVSGTNLRARNANTHCWLERTLDSRWQCLHSLHQMQARCNPTHTAEKHSTCSCVWYQQIKPSFAHRQRVATDIHAWHVVAQCISTCCAGSRLSMTSLQHTTVHCNKQRGCWAAAHLTYLCCCIANATLDSHELILCQTHARRQSGQQ